VEPPGAGIAQVARERLSDSERCKELVRFLQRFSFKKEPVQLNYREFKIRAMYLLFGKISQTFSAYAWSVAEYDQMSASYGNFFRLQALTTKGAKEICHLGGGQCLPLSISWA
jgi:hypothetical protein